MAPVYDWMLEGDKQFRAWTYINGVYVELQWDAKRKAYVVPGVF